MRRLLVVAVSTALLIVPALSATAQTCAAISGDARLDFANNIGNAKVTFDGELVHVPFYSVGFEETGENTADIYFVWEFPQGDVLVVEHSTTTPRGGPGVFFNSTIEVLEGGSGQWSWFGSANPSVGKASIAHISGDLCIDV